MAKLQPITGEVLRWALHSAGLRPSKAEVELGLPDGSVTAWITEAAQPNQGQLAKLAKRLDRPASFFFLPEPPKGGAVPVEFRRFAGTTKAPGKETQDGIRLASRVQKTTAWVRHEASLGDVAVPRLHRDDPIEESATKLRKWLNWSTARQTTSANSDTVVTKAFRSALETRGIVVMHLSLDEGETRGFSLASDVAPVEDDMPFQRQPDKETFLWVLCRQSDVPREHHQAWYSNLSCLAAQSSQQNTQD